MIKLIELIIHSMYVVAYQIWPRHAINKDNQPEKPNPYNI